MLEIYGKLKALWMEWKEKRIYVGVEGLKVWRGVLGY